MEGELKPVVVGKEGHLTLAFPGPFNSLLKKEKSGVQSHCQGQVGYLVATLVCDSNQGVGQRTSGECEVLSLTLPPSHRWAALDPQRRRSVTPSCLGLLKPPEMFLVMTYME